MKPRIPICFLLSNAEEKRTGERLEAIAKSEIVNLVESKSSREAEIALANRFPEASKLSSKTETVRPAGEDQFRVQVTLNRQQMEKLSRVREIASHSNFGASVAELIEVIADEFLKRKDPLQREVKPRSPRPLASHGAEGSNSGHRCGSRYLPEIDHVLPVVLGGTNEAENLRLLCRAHNGLMAKKILGPLAREFTRS